ncbi:MAG: hypothetical protein ABW061_27980, partial [Polyangiaceae bacterium]
TRTHGINLAAPITDELLSLLESQSLDDWYKLLNRIYWNRNFQRDSTAIFAHLVEVMGSLSVLVSKKKETGAPVQRTVAKAIAWWFALCGKAGVKSVSGMIWGKFPGICPYCQHERHEPTQCTLKKKNSRGPDWAQLDRFGEQRLDRQPRTIAEWQRMFAAIYPPSTLEDVSKTFAKLTEEVGELAEAVRVFPAAPGYFLSEASDVFAWLMKLNNHIDEEADTPPERRGEGLARAFASGYPARCLDCNAAVCDCPPILLSTVGRIAHEVSPERSSYDSRGSFLTAEKASKVFGPQS